MPRSFDKSMHRNKVDVASMTNNFLDALAGVEGRARVHTIPRRRCKYGNTRAGV